MDATGNIAKFTLFRLYMRLYISRYTNAQSQYPNNFVLVVVLGNRWDALILEEVSKSQFLLNIVRDCAIMMVTRQNNRKKYTVHITELNQMSLIE